MAEQVEGRGGDANGGNVGPPEGNGDGAPGGGVAVDGLTPRQEIALTALLNNPTLKGAAAACGCGERTLHTWLGQPAFMRAYREARRRSLSHAMSLATHYAAHAVQALAKVMMDPKAAHASVVAAATALLRFNRESIELDDLAERLETLEAAAAKQRPLGLAR